MPRRRSPFSFQTPSRGLHLARLRLQAESQRTKELDELEAYARTPSPFTVPTVTPTPSSQQLSRMRVAQPLPLPPEYVSPAEAARIRAATPITPRDILTPLFPQVGEQARRVPVVGRELELAANFLTSPAGIFTVGVAPGLTAAGLAGQAALGTAGGLAEQGGAPVAERPFGLPFNVGPRGAGEVAGGFLTPGLATAPGRALIRRGATAVEARAPALARTLAEEAGARPLGGSLAERQRVLTDIIQEKEINPLTGRPTQEPPATKSPARLQVESEIAAGRTPEELLDETTAQIAGRPPEPPEPPREPPVGGEPPPPEGFAGNIRLSKYPDDIADELKRWADENPDAVQAARRGVRPDEEVLADARQLVEETGGDFAKLQRKWKPGEAWNAEEVTAIRGVLRQKTDAVLEAASAARLADSSANHARLLLAIEEQARVQQVVHGITAEAGRSLRAFRQEAFDAITATDTQRLEELLRRSGMDKGHIDALADRLGTLDLSNPVEVNNFLRSVNKPGVGDYIMEFWVNSILSGPKTHIINTLSNTAFAVTGAIERGLAAAVDIPLSRLQGRQVARFFQEVPAGTFGAVSGIDEGVRAALRTFRDGITPAQASKWEFRRTAFPGVAGRIIRLPGTALEAADSLFYSINHRAELNSLIVRQARSERLTGTKLVERIAELKQNPTENLIRQAAEVAEYRLFRHEPGKIVKGFMSLRETIPGGRFILPFLRTPGNLLAAGLERSPFGLLNPSLWRNVAAKSPEASDQIARLLLGSGVAAGLGAMVANGTIDITGSLPTNPAARDRFFREGKQPFAVKIGGMWIQYRRLEPFNQPLAQLASFVDAVKSGDKKTADRIAAEMITTLGNQFVSQTYLSGLSDFLDSIADPQKAGVRFGTRIATGFTPFSSALRTIAQMTDPNFRDPETLPEQFKAGIPGLSQQVPPRLTAFGEEAGRESPAVSPIQVTPAQQSALDAELERLDMEVGFTGRSIGGYKLDREQQFAYQRAAGQMTYMLLAEFTASEDYQALDDGDKAKLIDIAIQAARDEVRDPIYEVLKDDEFKGLKPEQQNRLIDALLGVR